LPGEARAAAAGQQRRSVLPAGGNDGEHIVDRARHDNAERHLAVVRSIGRVEGAAAAVEAYLAPDGPPQRGGQRCCIDARFLPGAWCSPRLWSARRVHQHYLTRIGRGGWHIAGAGRLTAGRSEQGQTDGTRGSSSPNTCRRWQKYGAYRRPLLLVRISSRQACNVRHSQAFYNCVP